MNPTRGNAFGGLSASAFSSMFGAIDGLRNRRALAAMLGCMVAGVLVAGLFVVLAPQLGYFMAFLGGVCMFIAGATGINAAGVLLMDQARGLPLRPLSEAVAHGVTCIPKFVLLALSFFAVALALFVALGIVYLICKIPFLGPLLFVVVFPLSVIAFGVTLCGLFVCMFLSLPAVWEGAGIGRAISQTLAIARSRLVESLLLFAVVAVLSAAVGFIVFGVLFTGLMPSVALMGSILGGDGLGSMFGFMQHRNDFGGDAGAGVAVGGASYVVAAGIGAALLWALAGSLLSLVYLLGLNLVYLRVTEGLDVEGTEAALKARFGRLRRQAPGASATSPAPSSATPAASAASASTVPFARAPSPVTVADVKPRARPPESTAPSVAKAITCPQCLSSVAKGDAYCGTCGHRLI
jgi:hypothetical protein